MKYGKLVFTKPWTVEFHEDEIDLSNIPSGHLAIRTHYTLISPGTELACLSGNESWFKLPDVPGYISVGEVVRKGPDVDKTEVGDVVFQYGPHAEYAIIPADRMLMKVPNDLAEDRALFARAATIAMTAIRVSDIELGDYVAVTGVGLVGNMAAQLACLQGGNVIAIDLNPKRLELATACGVEFCINAGAGDVKDQLERITSSGASTLIEATGSPKVTVESLPLIAQGGEIILLGSPRGEFRTDVTDVLNYCHLFPRGCITFKGAHEWRYPTRHDSFVKHSIERNTSTAFDLIRRGKLFVDPLLTHTIRPDTAQSAYDGLRDKKDEYFGVVMDWR